jgi:hypothetical protein
MRLQLCTRGISTLWLIGVLTVLDSAPVVGKTADRASTTTSETIPLGLSQSDWSAIRQEYERHRHAAFAVTGGYQARNYSQQWLTHFDGRGFEIQPDGAQWTWGLQLESYGRAGGQRVVCGRPRVMAVLDRVSYEWSEGVREWWVNDGRGLEHSFTVRERPSAAGDSLVLRLAVRGGLQPRVHEGSQAISFVDASGRSLVNYSGLKVWDADGQVLPARMQVFGATIQMEVDERSAHYPLTIDPIAQQAYLKAFNTEASDLFGDSIAVSGNTVVVGAPGEASNATGVNGNQSDNSVPNSGAAYVFVRNAGVWTQQAYLKASNTGLGDWFGYSVAVSGDTVVVGAPFEDSNATGVNGNQSDNSTPSSGAAYVFVRNAGAWSQQAYLKPSNTGAGHGFGGSVATSADTVVVGAPGDASNAKGVNGDQSDNSAPGAGAAYVFVRNAGMWNQQAYLKASNTEALDGFGWPVAVSGDTVVVGAIREGSNATGVNGNQSDNSAQYSGAAYVFVRNAEVWTQQAYLKASNTDTFDFFGVSIAVSGDTVVVGASGEDSGSQIESSILHSGAAYVFVRNAGVWTQQAYLKGSNTEADYLSGGDSFAQSVAVSGDTVVVGAPGEASNTTGVNGNQSDNSATDAGAAYVFVRNAGVWTQQAYLKASNTGGGDEFGWSVAISGDTVVVGAHYEASNATGGNGNQSDNSAPGSGAAYVFLIPVRIECTGCYFLSNNLRATVAFQVTVDGASGTFSYQYRSATQTIQFASTTLTQVQVSGDTATFSGQGTLNGQAGYEFAVTAKDGGTAGAGQDSVSVVITGPNNYSYAAAGTIVGGDIVVAQ